jgi:hypothetical protein
MIKLRDIVELTDSNTARCFKCKRNIQTEDFDGAISVYECKATDRVNTIHDQMSGREIAKVIFFHKHCWELIAGIDYVFEQGESL